MFNSIMLCLYYDPYSNVMSNGERHGVTRKLHHESGMNLHMTLLRYEKVIVKEFL